MKNHVQRGDVITITAGGAIAAGQVVVVGRTLGVACHAATIGGACEVALTGVYTVPKVSGAEIAAGEPLVWDVSANSSAGAFDDALATPATGDVSGPTAIAFEAAGNGVTSLRVRFTGVPGTVT